ncbi:hypothetical protein [Halorarum salinum]|uniref:Uncharacterized protein n=1 Tax=Halorarum salinum TaxID=2743089 RepID=A0A7D5LA74_9EURY|nr:hypothetical protein [Halobaculum salinum]QLG61966.1 hypothetical protein HUG12_09635 [Halobaculum salinum]
MDYSVRIRRPATANARQYGFEYVHYTLAYLRDLPDLRGEDTDRIREVIQDHLVDGLSLRDDVDLETTEHVVVIPNPSIGVKHRKNTKAIYNDELAIPDTVIDAHEQDSQRRGAPSQ